MTVKNAKLEIEELKFRVFYFEILICKLLELKIMVMKKSDIAMQHNAYGMIAKTHELEDLYRSFIAKARTLQTTLKRKVWYREHEILGIKKVVPLPEEDKLIL